MPIIPREDKKLRAMIIQNSERIIEHHIKCCFCGRYVKLGYILKFRVSDKIVEDYPICCRCIEYKPKRRTPYAHIIYNPIETKRRKF